LSYRPVCTGVEYPDDVELPHGALGFGSGDDSDGDDAVDKWYDSLEHSDDEEWYDFEGEVEDMADAVMTGQCVCDWCFIQSGQVRTRPVRIED